MHKEPESLVRLRREAVCHQGIALRAELGDRIGNGVVQAPIQGPELFDMERCVPLVGQLGDGLAEVSVVMNHLLDSEPEGQEGPAVSRGGHADLRQRERIPARRPGDSDGDIVDSGLFRDERAYELLEKQRDAVGKLFVGGTAVGAP